MKLLLALSCVIVFWNVENFFDPAADSDNPSELSFTPSGSGRWSRSRYRTKARAIAKLVLALADSAGAPPDLVGLCEVENARCLRELVSGTALRKYGYRYIHYDSPDPRGIDCALLYRSSTTGATPSLGRLLASRSIPLRDSTGAIIPTRALLLAEFDSLSVIICHLPSKRGGSASASRRRTLALCTLSQLCDSLSHAPTSKPYNGISHSSAGPEASFVPIPTEGKRILVMGDFNDTRTAESDSLMRPMFELSPEHDSPLHSWREIPSAPGTIKFQGIWEQIDRAFISEPSATLHIIALPILTTPDKKFGGTKPLRTYQGPRYLGGVSDHYPIMVILSPSQ